MYEVAVIGTGPAGLSAVLTLKQLNRNFIWIGSKNLSPKINSASEISNYPGLINVSGREMKEVFLKQIASANIEITDLQVTGVYNLGDHYSILCGDNMFEAKTVILGLGVESIKPIEGELDYVGMGISYCATCDGMLYKNKDIIVYSTSKEFEHEVEFLASLANSVKFIPLYKEVNVKASNIEIIKENPKKITKENKKMYMNFKDRTIEADGIFMLKQAISPSILVPGIESQNGHIVIDRECKTNMPGLFACGDCTGRPYQYAKAVGEGNVAAHSALDYLNKK